MRRYSKIFIILAVLLIPLLISGATLTSSVGTGVESGGGVSADWHPSKNLLLIGWDGVQREHLSDLLESGKLPNLSHIINEGSLVTLKITDHATDTKSGWTQIITGLPAEKSGVLSNRNFQPIPKDATIFEILESKTDRRIFTAFIASKSHNLGSLGPNIKWGGGKGSKREGTDKGEPWMNAKGAFDLWLGDTPRDAEEIGRILIDVIKKLSLHNFFAIFVHFADPDRAGHKFGENSLEYEEAIMRCDEWLGLVTAFLKKKGLWDDTVLVVTTDHGFDEGKKSHTNAPDCFFVINDRNHSFKEGTMLDIAPTILYLLGLKDNALNSLPGKPLWE